MQRKSSTGILADATCAACGLAYRYDELRHCWQCDGVLCPHCMDSAPQPLCSECHTSPMHESIRPMLATPGDLPPRPSQWAAEFKWDGVRAITYWDGATLRIESRNQLNITARYPEFRDLGKLFGSRQIILDGEIVALDENGLPSFSRLQQRMHLSVSRVDAMSKQVPAYYLIFDLLFADGDPLMHQPYIDRREMLEERKIIHPFCSVPPSMVGANQSTLDVAAEHGLEGVVCKQLDSRYHPGVRSPQWIKVKLVQSEELIIGGWIPEKNNPERVGALLVGYRDKKAGLHYAGSVGTGFDAGTHQLLVSLLSRLRRATNPFHTPVPKKNVIFVTPKLVAQIEYRRWPKTGLLQQAAFKGLRTDKSAAEILLRRAS